MKKVLMIVVALVWGLVLDGAFDVRVETEPLSCNSSYNSELSADMVVQIDCARTYNSDLKLPSVPSVTAPQHVEQVSRNDYGGERRAFCFSVVRAAGAGRVYVSTKPLSRLFVGGAPSDYAICMLCRLII